MEKPEIELGGTEKVESFYAQTQRIMLAVHRVSGIDGALVTDRTMLSDFMLDQEQVDNISKIIGIIVTDTEFLGDMAQRLFHHDAGTGKVGTC